MGVANNGRQAQRKRPRPRRIETGVEGGTKRGPDAPERVEVTRAVRVGFALLDRAGAEPQAVGALGTGSGRATARAAGAPQRLVRKRSRRIPLKTGGVWGLIPSKG